MNSLETAPLVLELKKLNPESLHSIQAEHALSSLKELTFLESSENLQTSQLQKNILFLDEFEKLRLSFKNQTNTALTPLKGLSLLTNIYRKTLSRSMTDMDVYTHLPEDRFTPLLKEQGYEPQAEIKWRYNQHKYLFKKQHALLDITCEVHTQLIPRQKPYLWSLDEQGRLLPDEEFLYLCYHWAEQHTCLKLFWLFDLYFYTQKCHFDPSNLWNKAEQLQMTSSLLAAHWALKNCFHINLLKGVPSVMSWRSLWLKKILTPSGLTHIHQRRPTYLLLKHLLKDRLSDHLFYNFGWIFYQLKKRFTKLK